MSYVIHVKKSSGPSAWLCWTGDTENEREANVFATKEQADAHYTLAGLWRHMYKLEVRTSKMPVNVPGPGSNYSYEGGPITKKMAATKSVKSNKAAKQLSLF